MRDTLASILPWENNPLWNEVIKREQIIREIHLSREKPIVLDTNYGEFFLQESGSFTDKLKQAYILQSNAFERLFEHLCRDSVYAFESQLAQGYVTLCGGFRIGACGELILQPDGSFYMSNISSLNLRVAHDLKLQVEQVVQRMHNRTNCKNTLFLSSPGAGKTTMLRNVVRALSEGTDRYEPMRVGVVDERKEISGFMDGKSGFSLGMRTDILLGVEKAKGIQMMLRAMAPDMICVDELGGQSDFEAIREACRCGVGVVATMHAGSMEEAMKRAKCWGFSIEEFFQCFFLLQKEWKTKDMGKQIYFSVHEVTP